MEKLTRSSLLAKLVTSCKAILSDAFKAESKLASADSTASAPVSKPKRRLLGEGIHSRTFSASSADIVDSDPKVLLDTCVALNYMKKELTSSEHATMRAILSKGPVWTNSVLQEASRVTTRLGIDYQVLNEFMLKMELFLLDNHDMENSAILADWLVENSTKTRNLLRPKDAQVYVEALVYGAKRAQGAVTFVTMDESFCAALNGVPCLRKKRTDMVPVEEIAKEVEEITGLPYVPVIMLDKFTI